MTVAELSDSLQSELERNAIVDPRDMPVRFSCLKQMARSPLHYWQAVQSNFDETLAMRLGSATHALLFGKPIATWTGKVRRGKDWDTFETLHRGEAMVNVRERAEAEAMVKSIRANALASELLLDVVTEHTLMWSNAGRLCRSTPDARNARFVIELKTTKSADPDRFSRDAIWRGYHAQLAFYLDAVRESGLGAPSEAYVIAVESSPPYPVTVLRLTERALDQGRRLCRLWFERLLQCEASNEWPAYSQSIMDLDVPDEGGIDALIWSDA